MDRPLDIAFHNTEPSAAVEADIRQHVEKLAARHPHLVGCRVSVEALHNQHRTGNVFEVHVVLSLPGRDLAVSRTPHHAKERRAHPDVHASLKEAFERRSGSLPRIRGSRDRIPRRRAVLRRRFNLRRSFPARARLRPRQPQHAAPLPPRQPDARRVREVEGRRLRPLRGGGGDTGPAATRVWPA